MYVYLCTYVCVCVCLCLYLYTTTLYIIIYVYNILLLFFSFYYKNIPKTLRIQWTDSVVAAVPLDFYGHCQRIIYLS